MKGQKDEDYSAHSKQPPKKVAVKPSGKRMGRPPRRAERSEERGAKKKSGKRRAY